MTTLMICPVCNKEIEKLLAFGACPHCKSRLKGKIIKDDSDVVSKSVSSKEVFTVLSNKDQVEIRKSNLGNYIVTFTRPMNNHWIYCPNCQSKLFMNNTLRGSMSPKCKKCKSVITFVFIH